ncbi:TonB-dependent receptor [Sorangium sp. So ce216]
MRQNLLRRTHPVLSILGAALLLTGARVAWAEEAQRPALAVAPAVTPPRPLAPPDVGYPEDARGNAVVLLVITVSADGTVRSASASEGPEPFASAAIAAASAFRFAPATRDGAPIASKIRLEIRFTAPASLPPAPAPGAAEPPPPQVAPGAAPRPAPERPTTVAPLEVTVRGEAKAPPVAGFSRAEVRLIPGAFGDPFRAVEALPGVTPLFSGAPYFYVRGAPPGNVGYFLDGIRVPLLYHIGFGPSVVNPALVQRVDLYPGGYPARYGRHTGGIVAGETRPPLPEAHGEGALRLVDAGALVEAPFAGGRGAALAGGRYSYTGPIVSLFAPGTSLSYWDYQARVGYDLTPHDRVSAFAFGASDYLGQRDDAEDTTHTTFAARFHRLDLRYDRRFGADTTLRHAVTLGRDATQSDDGREVTGRMLGARAELDHAPGPGARFRAGAGVTLEDTDVNLRRTEVDATIDEILSPRLDITAGGFLEADLEVTPRLQLSPGLRLDILRSEGATWVAIEPRIAARLTVAPGVRFVHAHGLASQPPSFIATLPGFQPSIDQGLQWSLQSSGGIEVDLPEDVEAKLTLFRNAFFDMTDTLGTSDRDNEIPVSLARRSLGASTGLELSLRRRLTHRLGGFLAYTLSRSTRAFDRYEIPSTSDRTHVLNLAVSHDLGRGYRAGSRLVFYTGTPTFTGTPSQLVPNGVPLTPGLPRHNIGRYSSFFRIDVRAEKRWSIGRTGWLSAVIEVLNPTLSREAVAYDCSSPLGCEVQWMGPITIPSVGLEGGF